MINPALKSELGFVCSYTDEEKEQLIVAAKIVAPTPAGLEAQYEIVPAKVIVRFVEPQIEENAG